MTRVSNSHSSAARKAPRLATRVRKTASQARSRATVDAILRATAHILVREGYDHLTTNRVADRAGVSIGSLYQYFPGKEALVKALLDRHVDITMEGLRREAPGLLMAPLER